jgi:hypothetical protein
MPNTPNRGRYSVALSADSWRAHAEPLPGLVYIGVIVRQGIPAGLAQDAAGEYFAVNGRRVSPLILRKVESALLNAAA